MIAHLAYCRRADGHVGGVPKFGWYLERALPTVRQFAWVDFPEHARCESLPEHEKAELLGAWLWAKGGLADAEHIIADGFWANGLPDTAPVTAVCHGTWAELARRVCGGLDARVGDPGRGCTAARASVDPALIAAQDRAFKRWPAVAVSEAAARQLREHHGVEADAVIPNGVDTALFKPRRRDNPRPVVIHAATGYAKGVDVVRQVERLLPDFEVRFLDAGIGEEPAKFAAGDVFLFPSKHEGNSYALLEAMACGLPVVASPVGLLETVKDRRLGVIVESHDALQYAEAVRRVWRSTGCQPVSPYNPRAWVLENATFEHFAAGWRRYLRLESGRC